jgi:hypothetical protein
MERDTSCTSTLLVYSMVVGRVTPCTSILLVVERDTLRTSILLAVDGIAMVLHVQLQTAGGGNGYILHAHKQLLPVSFWL